MKVKFASNVEIDLAHIPEDFEDRIRESFKKFTIDTAKDYTYQDKLAYIDVMRRYLHEAHDAEECVRHLMHECLNEVIEYGDIPNREDYLSVEFMTSCFDAGRTNLYAQYTRDHHVDEVIMQLMVRAIKVVINY